MRKAFVNNALINSLNTPSRRIKKSVNTKRSFIAHLKLNISVVGAGVIGKSNESQQVEIIMNLKGQYHEAC